ncbi:MAG: NUDIX domain-containing protein [Porticoccaceae bacterium]|nr:NUDIX domain-containing protein [Porticoccaceae bacterium]
MIEVYPCVSFLLAGEQGVLLERRAADKKLDPGLVAIPGGHMESGESQLQTLERELREELAVQPLSSHYLCSLYHPTSELQLIHYYVVAAWAGEIQSLEAEAVFWCQLENAPAQMDIDADKTAMDEYVRLLKAGFPFQ